MQEFTNGIVLFKNGLREKNFAVDKGRIYFDYPECKEKIDLKGKIVCPGFVDVHVHTRTPGFTYKEDIKSVSKAALKGGFTTILAMANIEPQPYDQQSFKEVISFQKNASINIIQSGRITHNGQLSNFEELSKLTSFLSDDGEIVASKKLMKQALQSAKQHNLTLILHEQNPNIKGISYKSKLALKNKFPTFDHRYESSWIERDILLNKNINAPIHVQHLSTTQSIKLVNEAQLNGMNISAEATPHHLFFDTENMKNHGHYRMNPPLPNRDDRYNIIKAIRQEVIKIVATDHAPHSNDEKNVDYEKALNGVIGLESAFGAMHTILSSHNVSLTKILRCLTYNPAAFLGIDIEPKNGDFININIIDPELEWVFKKEDICSKSNNSPFINQKFKGKVIKTFFHHLHLNPK